MENKQRNLSVRKKTPGTMITTHVNRIVTSYFRFSKILLADLPNFRVPTAPGKPGKMTSFFSPGKVLELYNFVKNPGKWE